MVQQMLALDGVFMAKFDFCKLGIRAPTKQGNMAVTKNMRL